MCSPSPHRDPADHTPAHSHRSSSRYRANVQASRDAWVQLCASSLVKHQPIHIWSQNIVCNYSSLTSVHCGPQQSTSSVCKGHFMHSLVIL
ncbi:hypothetical protein AGOR_G00128520 [Albula goreensis]|uniref:Uncharacterized protein n=1 Tax=Albula goreensis TaxID=1534307 RepID=A0A8T3DCJ7_9TELE|nr:hypothetical protein AGOR_G00128520 [Albula goreensis]